VENDQKIFCLVTSCAERLICWIIRSIKVK
jgi:hypothetical protein